MKRISFLFATGTLLSGLCLIFSCKSSQTSASKPLHLKLEKGNAYDYKMTTEMDEGIISMNMTADYSLDVIGDDAGIKTVGVVYTGLNMSMNFGEMKMKFGSDQPVKIDTSMDREKDPSNMLNKVFGAIKGKRFTIKVDTDGNITAISGVDDLLSGMSDSTDEIGGKERAQMMPMLKKQFEGGELRNQFSELFYFFPSKDVKVGDTWEKSYEVPLPDKDNTGAKMIHTTTFKVKGIEGDMVTLSSDTKIESVGTTKGMSGAQKGLLIVDSRSGLLVSNEYETQLRISGMGIDFPMKAKTIIKGTAK